MLEASISAGSGMRHDPRSERFDWLARRMPQHSRLAAKPPLGQRRMAESPSRKSHVYGSLMLCEVLQGLGSERAARDVEALLRRFPIVAMAGDAIAVLAARNFRSLRRSGITMRRTIDLFVGTWCIENRMPLLHNDGDFRPMARHLGLAEVPVAA